MDKSSPATPTSQSSTGRGKEFVADYPRTPRVEASARHIQVCFNNVIVAETVRALRVLEKNHPPIYYVPPEDVRLEYMVETARRSMCEFKGRASYYSIAVGERRVEQAAWYYPDPLPGYESIRSYVAFYASRVDFCSVDGEQVIAQPGDFYGGWITSEIEGPYKGGSGLLWR